MQEPSSWIDAFWLDTTVLEGEGVRAGTLFEASLRRTSQRSAVLRFAGVLPAANDRDSIKSVTQPHFPEIDLRGLDDGLRRGVCETFPSGSE